MGLRHRPLERRTFRYKNPKMEFFCPLCGTQRAFTINHRLTFLNYMQITVTTAVLSALLWPVAEWRSLFIVFPIWLAFELVRRALFSKEIPCPHCGFDASWYKRDVKMARKKVGQFWDDKGVETLYSQRAQGESSEASPEEDVVIPVEPEQSTQSESPYF